MGACMNVGLCTKMFFSKKDTELIKKYYPNILDFQTDFEKETNLALQYYDVTESEQGYVFTVKPALFKPNELLAFLQDFLSFLCNDNKRCLESYNDMLEKLSQFNSATEILAYIENENNFTLQLSDVNDSVSFSSKLYLEYTFYCVSLVTYYKAYIEFADALFSYLVRLVQSKHPQPQAKLIKFFIDG